MSWSAQAEFSNGNFQVGDSTNTTSDEHNEQWHVALDLAERAIASGVVGDPKGTYKVSMNGHGNPDHKPAEGWANDFVSINIYQVTE